MKKQINPTIKAHLIRGAFYCFCFWLCAPFHSRWRSATLPDKTLPALKASPGCNCYCAPQIVY